MFGRTMVIVGIVAAAGLAATGVQGLQVGEGGGASALRLHVLLAMASLLIFLLAHSWILFYTVGTARVLAETARAAGREEVLEPALSGFRRRTLPPLLAAVALALAAFITGAGVYARWAPAAVHAGLLWAALAAQAWAAWAEWRTVTASERAVRRLRSAA